MPAIVSVASSVMMREPVKTKTAIVANTEESVMLQTMLLVMASFVTACTHRSAATITSSLPTCNTSQHAPSSTPIFWELEQC